MLFCLFWFELRCGLLALRLFVTFVLMCFLVYALVFGLYVDDFK